MHIPVIFSEKKYCPGRTRKKAEGKEIAEKIQGDLLMELDLSKIQEMVNEILGEDSFSFREALNKMIHGEEAISKETSREIPEKSLFFRPPEGERIICKAAAPYTCGSSLLNFSSVFENSQAGDISFYIVYLLLFTLLADSFFEAGNKLYQTILWMMEFMKALAPAYFITVAAASGAVSAAVFVKRCPFWSGCFNGAFSMCFCRRQISMCCFVLLITFPEKRCWENFQIFWR